MGLTDIFKASKIKAENEELRALVSPELQDAVKRQEYLKNLEAQIAKAEKQLGKKTQGNKMIKDMQKLLLRAFNSECDDLISKVKYNSLM